MRKGTCPRKKGMRPIPTCTSSKIQNAENADASKGMSKSAGTRVGELTWRLCSFLGQSSLLSTSTQRHRRVHLITCRLQCWVLEVLSFLENSTGVCRILLLFSVKFGLAHTKPALLQVTHPSRSSPGSSCSSELL